MNEDENRQGESPTVVDWFEEVVERTSDFKETEKWTNRDGDPIEPDSLY